MQVSLTSSPGLHHCPTFDCLQYAKIGGEGGREEGGEGGGREGGPGTSHSPVVGGPDQGMHMLSGTISTLQLLGTQALGQIPPR